MTRHNSVSISRNGVPSDWSGLKPFPGDHQSTTTVYNYHTYSVNSGVTPFILITIDSVPGNTFASAYFPSYNPTMFRPTMVWTSITSVMPGVRANFFGVDPLSFEVFRPGPFELPGCRQHLVERGHRPALHHYGSGIP